jgi:hypothetical protein
VRDSHRASASRGDEAETSKAEKKKSGADDLKPGVTRENGVNPKAQIFRYFARFGRARAPSTESVSASL